MVPFLIGFVPTLLSKMVMYINIVTFLMLSTLFSFLPLFLSTFGGEVALIVFYTINHIPSLAIHNKSPFELLYS